MTGAIRIYDFATGELLALLRGHTNVVLSLAFAPDRRRLISGGAYGRAILWDVGDWGQAKRADARPRLLHKLEGHKDDVIAVGFTPDGARALTGSFDTTLRLWDAATGKPVDASMTGQKNKVRALAVNPRDGSIVSGGDDGEIRVWNGTTGKFRRPLANIDGVIGTLTFNSDGTRLLASCGQRCKSDYGLVFAIDSGKEITRYTAHNNVVFAAAISPDGRWAATGGSDNHEIHIWALDTGERRRGPDGQSLMLGGSGALGQAAGFSADGRSVAWGNTSTVVGLVDRRPLEYQLRLPGGGASLGRPERITAPNPLPIEGQTMGRGDAPAPAFLGARVGHGAWSLVHRPGGTFGDNDATLDIRQDGKAVASITRGPSDGYVHRAYSFSTDGNAIVSAGANGILIAYDLAGKELAHFVGHEGDVRAVTPSADGRYLISASADQTIRLWPLSSLSGSGSAPIVIRPIVTLFHGRDGEWVMWTPEGYYTASARGSDLIGWQINKGADKVPEHVTAGQLRQWFNRPDIVDKAILLASSAEAVRTSNGTSFKLEDLIRRPAPRLALLSPTVNATVSGGKIAVKFRIDPTPDPVKAIRVQVNGRLVRLDEPPTGAGGFQPGERTVEVPLASGRNTLQIALLNDVGWSSAEAGTLVKVDQRRDIGMQ